MSETSAPVTCDCSASEADPSWRGRLERLPRGATAGVIVALLLVGLLIAHHWAGAVLAGLGLLAFAAVIAATWSRITLVERLLRVAVFVLLTGLTLVRVLPN